MVSIEKISENHIKFVHKYGSDKRISDTCNVPYPYTLEMAGEWFKTVTARQESSQAEIFAILEDTDFVGVISLNEICLDTNKAEVDYWVGVKFQGKGIATLAVAELVTYANEKLGISTFYSSALARNYGSHAVQRKNGFVVIEEFELPHGKFYGEKYVVSKLEVA